MALGQGVGVLPLAGGHEAFARGAVEGVVAGVADLREAEDELAQWSYWACGAGAEPPLPASGARKTMTMSQDPNVVPSKLISCSRASHPQAFVLPYFCVEI